MPRIVCACCLLMFMGGMVRADVHPERLAAFRLDKTPLLHGFVMSQHPYRLGSAFQEPTGATAIYTACCFHGASEVVQNVLMFPTIEARNRWLQVEASQNSAMSTPSLAMNSQRTMLLSPGNLRVNGNVNKIVYFVYGFQHSEAQRRDPKAWEQRLSNRELARRVQQIARMLASRANSFPANR